MTCVATAWDGMEQQRDEWSSKGMANQSSDEQWNGKEKLGKAMAMDARCGFDKQRKSMEQKRVAMAMNSEE